MHINWCGTTSLRARPRSPRCSDPQVYELVNTSRLGGRSTCGPASAFITSCRTRRFGWARFVLDSVDEHVFEPGMVVCLEPDFSYFHGMTMELGNMILVTDDGHEVLNSAPLDLLIQ